MVSTAAVHAERDILRRLASDDAGPCVLATVVEVKGLSAGAAWIQDGH